MSKHAPFQINMDDKVLTRTRFLVGYRDDGDVWHELCKRDCVTAALEAATKAAGRGTFKQPVEIVLEQSKQRTFATLQKGTYTCM